MFELRRFVLGAVIAFAFASPAAAIDPPDDRPWDEIDRVLKDAPKGDDAGQAPVEADPNSEGPTAGAPPAETPAAAAPAGEPAPPSSAPVDGAAPPASAPSDSATTTPASKPSPTAAPAFPLPTKAVFENKSAALLRGGDEADIATLSQFYDSRQGDALWVTREGFNDAAKDLIAEIGRAADWGLKPEAFALPPAPEAVAGDDALAETDIKLSLAAMAYARHARGDRIPDPTTQLSSYLDRKPNLMDRATLLSGLAAAPSKSAYLTSLHPKHPQFHLLRKKLLEMRTATPEPVVTIPKGSKLKPGKSHPDIALIRKRLKVPSPGMKPDGTAAGDDFYDDALAGAVVRFKEKQGIEPANATITQPLRNALNGSGPMTEAIILANMEEWRWMPDDLGAVHIAVNIPEFTVRVIKDGHAIHSERVITGQTTTQTPIFSDQMRSVVFQPPWVVPDSIKVNELLPSLRAGGNPISGRGLVVTRNGRFVDPWSVDWYGGDIRNYDIHQPPGPSNVLGVVKFLFPNKHAVYLHDTPTKNLFNSTVRTFSHGCIRVRNPVRLAEVLMAEDKAWDAQKVSDAVENGPEDNDVALDRPIPIHITYFTAWVDGTGELKSFPDVYGHEKRIKLALAGRWNEIEKNRDHLLPVEAPRVAAGYPRQNWYPGGFFGFGGYNDGYDSYPRAPRYRPGYRYGQPPPKKKPSFFSDLF